MEARRRACLASAVALAGHRRRAPHARPGLGHVAISFSFFSIAAWSVNLYTMPLDTFGGERAAFSVSLLTGAYGAMQAVASPLIGAMIDSYRLPPVFVIVAVMPMAAYGILHLWRLP